MKKIAITLSAATLLVGVLVGCGDQGNTTGQANQAQRGFGYHATDNKTTDSGFTGQRAGEGPITDMFTRDDRRGARGFGRDNRQPATGLAGERGTMRETTGIGGGTTGTRMGQTTRPLGEGDSTGMFNGRTVLRGHGANTARTGRSDLGMHGPDGVGGLTNEGNGLTGAFSGTGRTGRGLGTDAGRGANTGMMGHGMAANPGWQGETGYTGGTRGLGAGRGNAGFRGAGAGGGMTGLGQGHATDSRYGAGVVGNRAGYVDNSGVLRDRVGETKTRGMTGNGFNTTNNVNGTGNETKAGTNNFSYPSGYDTTTVNDYTSRLADVENVRDSRVIVHENRVLIGVDADEQNAQRVEQDVRQRLRGMTGDREIVVITNRDQFNQIRTADDRLRGGEAFEEVGATINDMFHDFGRAIQRPFQQSR